MVPFSNMLASFVPLVTAGTLENERALIRPICAASSRRVSGSLPRSSFDPSMH
jgi:hypothetical protein